MYLFGFIDIENFSQIFLKVINQVSAPFYECF